ncbi:unconventional myosin-XVIIIa isoform X3 [Schistocerca cancellata]|uniref:unconventional myosin-XVIIIa isoform X3 n=1 Tax=Schistocerca cancellata TaxID=274614 RepID=UPI002118437F|nr:unconventional myosin-XVIIIa isoform X3 [Schistocerca cancellata]
MHYVSGCWQTTSKSRDDGHIPTKPELKSVIKITSETQERISKSDLQSPLISPPRMSNSCDNLSTVIAVNYVPNSSSSGTEKTALAPPGDSSSAPGAVTFSPTVIPINYNVASSQEQRQPPVPPRKMCFNGKSSVWGKLRARSYSQPSLTNEALNINVRHEESAPPLPPRPSLSAMQNKSLSRAVSAVNINDLSFSHMRYGNHLPSKIPRRLPSPSPPVFSDHSVTVSNGDVQTKNNNQKDIVMCGKSDLQCVLQKYEELEKECEDLVSHSGKRLADKHAVYSPKPNHNRSASEASKRTTSETVLSSKSSPRNVCLVSQPDKKIVRSKSVDRCKNSVFSETNRSRRDGPRQHSPEKSHSQDRNHKPTNVRSNSPLAKAGGGVTIKSTLKRDFFSTESLNNKTDKTQAIHPKSDVVLTQKNVTDDCKNVNVKQLVLKNEKLGNKMTISTSLNANEDTGDSKSNSTDDKANVGNVFRHLRSLSSDSQKSLYGLIHLYHSGGYWTGFPKLSKEEVDPLFKNMEKSSKVIEDVKQRKVEKIKNQKTDYSNILAPGGGIGVVRAYTGRQISDSRYRTELEIFFRSGVLAQLEAQRDERLTDHVVRLQAQCRGYLARRKLHKLKIQDLAVRCIQRNVRKFLLIRDWPWWRLLVRVTPLLNVHRTEEELRAKTEELEALRAKVEKLEQERTHLKHDTDRLEAKLSEMTADLAEEHSTATLATERLEAETAERLRLEKELSEVQYQKQNLQQTSERLEMELLCMRSAAEVNGLGSDDEGEGEDSSGSVYKQRYERAVRELEFTRRRLQQQHEDDLEQLVALKKQLEKKLADAYEEVEEQRQVVGQWKRKVQKLNAEMSDLRLLLEEQNSRNNLLEKKQRKFDSELQLLQDELRQEKQQKERISREKDLAIAEKYSLEQDLSGVRLELELKEEKVSALTQELDELTFGGKTEEEVAQLKKAKHELEKRLKEQEEELDELAGQVQLLEQAKLRLEMSLEQQRKESRREAAQRDEELEDARCAAHKKVKALEAQLESEHEERTALLRERHELERRLAAAEEMARAGRSQEEEQLQRLRRDLRRTKALLRDAQAALERARADSPGKALVRQLRNQLEDLEVARAAAVKARQTAELELSEVQAMLEEAQRSRSEAEDRAAAVARERSELRTQLEENEEELAEVLKKYRSTVQQLSAEQLALQEQAGRVSELESERASLREQLAELTTRLESMETLGDPSSSLTQRRLEMRTKELESKLELEQTTRARLEVQIARLKEAVERLQDEAAAARAKEQAAVDASRKLQRTVRELREEQTAAAARESEWAVRKRDLEKRLEASEAEAAAARQDLRLALTRIEDLQSAIRGELEDGEDSNDDENSDSAQDSDVSEDSMSVYLTNHKVHVNSSPRTTRASLELDITSRSLEVASLKKPNDSSGKESFA